jgi:hypothetical protein
MFSCLVSRLIGPGRFPEELTMRKHHSFCPNALSLLEDRVVLSQLGIAPAALVQPIPQSAAPVPQHLLALNGTISGTFVTTLNSANNPAAGTTTTFQGSGTITGLGKVSVTGSLVKLLGPSGQLSTVETFTLTSAQGSVTIQLTNSAPKTGSPSAAQSSFSIVKATGAFQGAIGTGTATLQTITELVSVSPPTLARGVFTLTLNSNSTTL